MANLGMVLLGLGVALLPIAAYIYVKRSRRDFIRNPSHADGVVVGASPINYSHHHTARVRYRVDGRDYEVDGPLFEWGSVGSFAKSNLTDRKHLPSRLVAQNLVFLGVPWEVQQNDYLYRYSAISELYPIGSSADVWYDPEDPSHAYVERPVRRGVLAVVFLAGWGLALIAFGAVIVALGSRG